LSYEKRDIRRTGFMTCKYWLKKGLWRELLPLEVPPQRGETAVESMLTLTVTEESRKAFIAGGNEYLDNPRDRYEMSADE